MRCASVRQPVGKLGLLAEEGDHGVGRRGCCDRDHGVGELGHAPPRRGRVERRAGFPA